MIFSSLSKYRDLGLLVMRLGLGVMFLYHGIPKLMGGPEAWTNIGGAMSNFGIMFAPAFWGFMAAVSEAGGGVCLILGLALRPACLFLLATMFVAVTFHLGRGDILLEASHAIEDGIVFIGLFIIGPGKYSLDKS